MGVAWKYAKRRKPDGTTVFDIFELHPALTGYLREAMAESLPEDRREAWTRAFVDVMGTLAGNIAPKPPHEQRGFFRLFGGSFHAAEKEAEHLGMNAPYRALLQAQGSFALNTRNFDRAEMLYEKYAARCRKEGFEEGEAAACHQLGNIAYERRDFDAADGWYKKSLDIELKLGNEPGAATTYHQLGMIAQERRDFDAADGWYKKAAAVFERLEIEQHAAMTYGQLGILAGLRENYPESGRWLIRSIQTFLKWNDPHQAQRNVNNFMILYTRADAEARRTLEAMWRDAGLGALPKPRGGPE
jgi:tetratricopeptide (TPR) repeat protein